MTDSLMDFSDAAVVPLAIDYDDVPPAGTRCADCMDHFCAAKCYRSDDAALCLACARGEVCEWRIARQPKLESEFEEIGPEKFDAPAGPVRDLTPTDPARRVVPLTAADLAPRRSEIDGRILGEASQSVPKDGHYRPERYLSETQLALRVKPAPLQLAAPEPVVRSSNGKRIGAGPDLTKAGKDVAERAAAQRREAMASTARTIAKLEVEEAMPKKRPEGFHVTDEVCACGCGTCLPSTLVNAGRRFLYGHKGGVVKSSGTVKTRAPRPGPVSTVGLTQVRQFLEENERLIGSQLEEARARLATLKAEWTSTDYKIEQLLAEQSKYGAALNALGPA